MQNILFIDRDGTLIEEPHDHQVDHLAKIRLCSHVIPALLRLLEAGFQLVMVSNQDGLGTPRFPQADFQRCHDYIMHLFTSQGIIFRDVFICPHTLLDGCACRKPKTGLLDDFLQNNTINPNRCWVIGDRETDKQLADNLGVAYLPITNQHNWLNVVDTILNQKRRATITRNTKETSIALTVVLDSDEPCAINTPIGFFNHMLEQIAKHGGFHLQITAKGDIHVDDHHLIEDTALALGNALKTALNDKWGIHRYGFTLPMDEALASVSIDLCGRSFCAFEAPFTREFVGGMATEMVPHFFNSLASSLGATMHVRVHGQNHHHMIEACFKALGRALQQAMQQVSNNLPSTKGIL
ncbi:bifunctional histidinol-phosphatase/imidazoleglycerol-phosphate dehydratase HisB [Legionella oakridgensis]|uniref:bifunctional histidinol-phosphatase/imidazoleglycerol-phosphate dehydratase HisB n=1 Tax=Legionella oakridgensis TaxID=29423 RepID=UPI0003DE03C2|nr:bifunctional histidinol-phosphatase/imidazoleglycerol-phosphate dehydratase HisB [Legionella oakridgensis]ETO93646.1 histidinol-phosphatase [Legionella oakridgensis RV-2-2007]